MQNVLLVVMVVCTLGCGKSEKHLVEQRRSAQQAFDLGVSALEKGDFAAAELELTAALERGGLYPDLYDTARASRAVSVAAQGKIGAAHALLDEMEQTALEKDLVLSARSYVFEKQGKKKQAKTAWAKARRINRSVKKIKD